MFLSLEHTTELVDVHSNHHPGTRDRRQAGDQHPHRRDSPSRDPSQAQPPRAGRRSSRSRAITGLPRSQARSSQPRLGAPRRTLLLHTLGASRADQTPTRRMKIPRDTEHDYTPECRGGAPRLPAGADRRGAEAPLPLFLRPLDSPRQHRELYRRGADPARPGRADHVHGEHAQGDFLFRWPPPRARWWPPTTAASRVLCGGVKCTVVNDAMQRAPVFEFAMRAPAASSRTGEGQLRGDSRAPKHPQRRQLHASTLPGRASSSTCASTTPPAMPPARTWSAARLRRPAAGFSITIRASSNFYLESNFATDKKASQVNIMRTRGKRVTAEMTAQAQRADREYARGAGGAGAPLGIANIGGFLSGVNNNGLHSANAITAMFIATGQDVANVSESSAGILYAELTPEQDLYLSLTIPR